MRIAVSGIAGLLLVPLLAGAPASIPQETPPSLSSLIATHELKRHIVKPPTGLLLHEYIVPDGPYFQLFDWDMYFMCASLSYD